MRSRRAGRLFHPLVLALLLLGSAPAIKQTLSQAVLPAIDRGLVQRVYRSPDSPETRVRARPFNRSTDRRSVSMPPVRPTSREN